MKRLVLAACMAFALAGSSCDDDGDTRPTTDGPGSEVRDGGTAAGMCTGTFATLTRTQLGAATNPAGKCASSGDLDQICTGDLQQKARDCGSACLQAGAPPATLPGCVSTCLQGKTMISSGCADCYRDSITCSATRCQPCLADPNSQACRDCQLSSGCLAAFFTCSGLPGGPPSDAGAPDTAVDTRPDAPADTRPDAPADMGADAPADLRPDAGADAADGGDGGGAG